MAKSSTAFRTIGEVAEQLGIPQHVLRFWETKFPQLRPLQRAGNRRYYRPEDVALVTRIQRLLGEEGYTIKGVQQQLAQKAVEGVVLMPDGDVPSAPAIVDRPLSEGQARFDARQRAKLLGIRELLLDGLARSN